MFDCGGARIERVEDVRGAAADHDRSTTPSSPFPTPDQAPTNSQAVSMTVTNSS
jgi:hypothetical protein